MSLVQQLIFAANVAVRNIHEPAYLRSAKVDAETIPPSIVENDRRSEKGSWLRQIRALLLRLPEMGFHEREESAVTLTGLASLAADGEKV